MLLLVKCYDSKIFKSPDDLITMYANPLKFYILSLGFSDIETKQDFVIGVYLLFSYGVSFFRCPIMVCYSGHCLNNGPFNDQTVQPVSPAEI